MAKTLTVEKALELYREKKATGQKTSMSIFKRRLTPKRFQQFKDKIQCSCDDYDDNNNGNE